jgi:excisionase family DNA binding protein
VEKLLRGEEVAALLNVSRSHAFMLMRIGELPTIKLGRCVRVRPADLQGYLAEQAAASRKERDREA